MLRRWLGVVVAAALATAVTTGIAAAQPKTAAPAQAKDAALPSGEALMAKYVDALGGQAAFDKIKNRVMEGSLDIAAAGIKLSLAVYSERPARMYMVADSDATGRIESGVVDGIAWENSAMRGAIVKDGAEKADALRDATFDRLIYWKDGAKSVECVAVADVDGKPAYKVVLTPKEGSAQTFYLDKETSLPVQVEAEMVAAGQKITLVSKPGDYRQVDGVKIPFSIKQVVMGQERTMTIEKVRHNVDLPADRFALPPAIKAIVEKK